MARHRLTAELDGLVNDDRLADAVAVAAELVGNAVRHGLPLPGDVVRMAWRLLPDQALEIRVTDGGSTDATPRARTAGPDAVDGRGLTIVDALSTEWGVEYDGRGQCVWARLA
jgi:anti-sigma regulatory factor (Ser/Thr protein kinase)